MKNEIKLNSKVRTPRGVTGVVVAEDKKTNMVGVRVNTQGLWELLWYIPASLEVMK